MVASYSAKNSMALSSEALSIGSTILLVEASTSNPHIISKAENGSNYYYGFIAASVWAMLTSMDGISSASSKIGVGVYLLAKEMVHAKGSSSLSFRITNFLLILLPLTVADQIPSCPEAPLLFLATAMVSYNPHNPHT